MNLEQIILSKLRREHRGIENAIIRQELLSYCRYYDFGLTDRELRRIVEGLASEGVCPSERGYYIARNIFEAKLAKEYLEKKAKPLFKRARKIYDYYEKGKQLELYHYEQEEQKAW